MKGFFFSTSLTFALCGYGRNESERPLKREEQRCFPQRCLPRAMLADLQHFSLWCHGALDKCIWENQFLLAPKPQGKSCGKILQQSGEEPSGYLDQALTPPSPLISCISSSARSSSHAGSQGGLLGCTPPCQPITSLLQGLNHQGGTHGTVFSITDGLQSQKKSLLSYFPQG